jgi:TonB family protein
MKLKLLQATLCLLSVSTLFTDGAIAQSGDYAGCVKYARGNSFPSLISVRPGEHDSVLVTVNINTEGKLTECSVVKGSGSDSLDGASCDWVKDHWRSLERCQTSRLEQISQSRGKP